MKAKYKRQLLSKLEVDSLKLSKARLKQLANEEQGLCPCGLRQPREGRVKCEICAERAKQGYLKNPVPAKERAKALYARRRTKVLEAYGGKCICCGESFQPFLCLDHINGEGHQHQQKVGKGTNFYAWVIKNGYPQNLLQILCANCNQAKGTKAVCPCKEAFGAFHES